MKTQNLGTEVVPKTGVRIVGDELTFRICVTSILSRYLEVGQDFHLTRRLANHPLQTMIAEYFLIRSDAEIQTVRTQLMQLIEILPFSNFLCVCKVPVYLSVLRVFPSAFRASAGDFPGAARSGTGLSSDEAHCGKYLCQSSDFLPGFSTRVMPPVNEHLFAITRELVRKVQNNIITRICDDRFIYEEVYAYLHKSLIRNTYHFSFYDNKLEETKEQYHRLYDILSNAISDYEETYQTRLSHFQIASLTLIFRKFTNRNKLAGRNRKKLVIVTNSSIEKIDFFMERMKFRVDVELLDVININELYLLEKLDYDFFDCVFEPYLHNAGFAGILLCKAAFLSDGAGF